MNLQQLYYFKAIAELEHFTRAAEVLTISQSSLSHAIQCLENELNAKLFSRKGRNVVLTKYGKLFLPYVKKSLEELEAGIATINDFVNPNTGTVTIASFPSLVQFVPDILIRYVSETNRVNVHLQSNQEATYFTLREQLLNGKVDLVFATEIDDPRIASTLIGEHELVLLVPAGHRLAQYEQIDLQELNGEDFVAYSEDCQLRRQYNHIFQEIGISPNITMETTQDLIIYGLVAANHGVAIAPYPLGGAPYNVKIVHIRHPFSKRKLYFMWNKETYLPPAAEYFRDFIVTNGLVFNEFFQRSNAILAGAIPVHSCVNDTNA